jgi:hypothetical protein
MEGSEKGSEKRDDTSRNGQSTSQAFKLACSKCRKDYETAPFCHCRPVTKERPGTESDTRRQAAKRVMGPSAILGQLQVLSLLALLVQKYKY